MSEQRLMLALGRVLTPSNIVFLTEDEALLAEDKLGWMGIIASTMRNKIASSQGIYFRPGTMTQAERLRTAFQDFDKIFPTPAEARALLSRIDGAEEVFSFDSEGPLWSIRATPNPDWAVARDRRWCILFDGTRLPCSFGFDELIEAMRLMPLLNGDHTEAEIRRRISGHEPQVALLEALMKGNAISTIDVEIDVPPPGFTFLGHSALYIRTPHASLVVDPAFYQTHNGAFDPLAHKLVDGADAILISHHHWDHLAPSTLVRIRRDMRFYVSRCTERTFANPDIGEYLRLLGFTDIVEVDPWDRARIGDIDVTFVPFYGEPFGLQSRFDGFTYRIKANGQTIYSSVDGRLDEAGSMDPVIQRLAEEEPVDFFLFGSSNQQFLAPSVAGYAWRFSNDLITRPELIRYHPNTDDALRWIRMLKPRYAIPFAQFLWDGAPAPDVSLPAGSTLKMHELYDAYWRQRADSTTCMPLDSPVAQLEVWKQRLDRLRTGRDVNLMLLHPLQRVVH